MREPVAGAALVVAALLAVGAGPAGASEAHAGGRAGATTDLTIRAINTTVGRAIFHLRCAPVGGNLPDPARACAALAADPELITSPQPDRCPGGPFSVWEVTITGRLDGTPVMREFATCWTPQMATLERLGLTWAFLNRHLLPRRHEAVPPGTTRRFARGVLQPADLITCDFHGRHLELGVPSNAGSGRSEFNGKSVGIRLTVIRHADGSVTAACLRER